MSAPPVPLYGAWLRVHRPTGSAPRPPNRSQLDGDAQFPLRQDIQVQVSAGAGTGLVESTNFRIRGQWYGVRHSIGHVQHEDLHICHVCPVGGVLVVAVQGEVVDMVHGR